MDAKLGKWAFIAGIALAMVLGLIPGWQTDTLMFVLVTLGFVVGFLNIQTKETTQFLVATMALIIIGRSGSLALGTIILSILANIVYFVAPAGLIVSLKAIWSLAQR